MQTDKLMRACQLSEKLFEVPKREPPKSRPLEAGRYLERRGI